MARCPRCNGCRSMWDVDNCPYCNYPFEDTRSDKEIAEDFEENEDE